LAPGESGIDLIAEDVILEEPATPAASGGSSRDLIAEGLESGVDLMGKAAKAKGEEQRTDALDDFLAQVTGDETSSVDLGSVQSTSVFEEPVPGGPSSSVPAPTPGEPSAVSDKGEQIDFDHVITPDAADEVVLEAPSGKGADKGAEEALVETAATDSGALAGEAVGAEEAARAAPHRGIGLSADAVVEDPTGEPKLEGEAGVLVGAAEDEVA